MVAPCPALHCLLLLSHRSLLIFFFQLFLIKCFKLNFTKFLLQTQDKKSKENTISAVGWEMEGGDRQFISSLGSETWQDNHYGESLFHSNTLLDARCFPLSIICVFREANGNSWLADILLHWMPQLLPGPFRTLLGMNGWDPDNNILLVLFSSQEASTKMCVAVLGQTQKKGGVTGQHSKRQFKNKLRKTGLYLHKLNKINKCNTEYWLQYICMDRIIQHLMHFFELVLY